MSAIWIFRVSDHAGVLVIINSWNAKKLKTEHRTEQNTKISNFHRTEQEHQKNFLAEHRTEHKILGVLSSLIRKAAVSNNFHFSHFVLTKIFVRLFSIFWKRPPLAFLDKNRLFHFQLRYQSHYGLSNYTKFGPWYRWTCPSLDSWSIGQPHHISNKT